MLTNKKAVTTALGGNPKVKTKGEGMSNGFQSRSLSTATVQLRHKKRSLSSPLNKKTETTCK
jgi:hypothetical protein